MARRPGEWHLVGHDRDPVPADHDDVIGVASDYRKRATSLGDAYDILKDLSELDGWRGDAAERFAESADDGLGDIKKARDKYDRAADALEAYADAVSTARRDTMTALRAAEAAEDVRRTNAVDGLAGVSEPTDAQRDAQRDRDRAASGARDDINAAAGDVSRALSALEDAAKTCAHEIGKAADSMEDGWFDDFKGWVRDHADLLKTIVKIIEWVAIAIAAIGLVLAFTIGAPFALIALGIAAAAAVLLIDAALVAAGEESWTKLIWDVAGLALSIFGGKLAIKALSQMGKLAPATTKAMDEVASVAAKSLPQNAKNALRITNPNNPLYQWGKTQLDDAVRASQQGLQQGLDNAAPKLGDVVRLLDREAANNLAKMQYLQGRFPNLAGLSGDLDQVAAGLKNTALANWTGTVGAVDAALDQVSDFSISDTVQSGMAELQEELSELHWRIKTVL